MDDNQREFIETTSRMLKEGISSGNGLAIQAAIATSLLDIAVSLRQISAKFAASPPFIHEMK